jgi:hypothetical protein
MSDNQPRRYELYVTPKLMWCLRQVAKHDQVTQDEWAERVLWKAIEVCMPKAAEAWDAMQAAISMAHKDAEKSVN